MSDSGSSAAAASPPPPDTGEISFLHELARKGTHMGALIIPGGYFLVGLSKAGMLLVMVPITCLMVLIDIARLRKWALWERFMGRLFSPMIRAHEHAGDFTGATYILASVCVTVGLYSKSIAIVSLAFIIVGDTLAALIGRRFGRHRFFDGKSIEGTLGCFAGTALVAVVACFILDLPLEIGLFGALVAAIVEALPLGIDDNVSVPLLSGLLMTLILPLVS